MKQLFFLILGLFVSVQLHGQDYNMGTEAKIRSWGWPYPGAANISSIDISGAPAPFDGIMRRWRIYSVFGGTVTMKVFRDDGTNYVLIAEDTRAASQGFNTFTVNITVQRGDLLGAYWATNDLVYCDGGGTIVTRGGNAGTSPKNTWVQQSLALSLDALVEVTGVEESSLKGESSLKLFQNSPNPFSSFTFIRYFLQQSGPVELTIHNISGELVRMLVNGEQEAGTYTVIWDSKDVTGNEVPSGIYFYCVKTCDSSCVKKMLFFSKKR